MIPKKIFQVGIYNTQLEVKGWNLEGWAEVTDWDSSQI